jgi:hypothetical protein
MAGRQEETGNLIPDHERNTLNKAADRPADNSGSVRCFCTVRPAFGKKHENPLKKWKKLPNAFMTFLKFLDV